MLKADWALFDAELLLFASQATLMELVHAEVDPDRLHLLPRAYDRAEALVANGMRLDHTLAVGARLRSKPLVRLYEITRTLNKDKLSVIFRE